MPGVLRASALLVLAACAAHDPRPYLNTELSFLQAGVQLEREEREVRRVFGQRGLRVVARLENAWFLALGAQTRDRRQSAVRVITRRGTVIAEDAAADDLFAPGHIALLETFGGSFGEYAFVALQRSAAEPEAGCVTLHRILPDGSSVVATLDVGALGSRACVASLAPARGGRLRATIAWPALHAIATPQLEVELALVEPKLGQPPPLVPVVRLSDQGDWLETARTHLNAVRLAGTPFSDRHAVGVASAAVARLSGQSTALQVAAYRKALAHVPPGSPEAEVVADTVAHLERGWLDQAPAPPAVPESPPADSPEPGVDSATVEGVGRDTVEGAGRDAEDVTVIEPGSAP